MAQYDGSIRINTQINVKSAERELRSLESNISKTADKIASLRSKMDALKNVKTPTQEYKDIQNDISKAETELEKLLEKQAQMQNEGKDSGAAWDRINQRIQASRDYIELAREEMQQLIDAGRAFTLGSDTQEYQQMSQQMQQLNQQMQSDTERQTELQNALAAEEERLAQIKANATVSDQNIIALLERRRQLMAEISDLERAGVGLGYQEYEDANRELADINNRIRAYRNSLTEANEQTERMQESTRRAGNAARNAIREATGAFGELSAGAAKVNNSLKSGIKTILKYSLGIRSLYALINKLRNGIKEGLQNFAQYSAEYNKAISSLKSANTQLKNSFATAFAPIVQIVIPYLVQLIKYITKALNAVSQFMAVLGGKSTWTRAVEVQEDYAASLEKTGSAAKKAFKSLAGFDKLNVLGKTDSDGGGAGGISPKDMFEEVPVDDKVVQSVEKLKNAIKSALENLKPLFDWFKKLKDLFVKGFFDGLGESWKDRIADIVKSARNIIKTLREIFTDPSVVVAAKTMIEKIVFALGQVVGSIVSIGITIAQNLVGGIDKYLEQNKEFLKQKLISIFDITGDIALLIGEAFKTFAYIFEAFGSESGQQLTANLIGIFNNTLLSLLELGLKFGRDILDCIITPISKNKEELRTALEGLLKVAAEVSQTVLDAINHTFEKMNKIYDKYFKPFFESIKTGLSELLAKFLEFWNGYMQPILDKWAEMFDTLMKEHIQPMIDNFLDLVGKIVEALTMMWENTIKPLIAWLIDVFAPTVADVWDIIVGIVNQAVTFIADVINGIIDIVEGVIDILLGISTGDWQRVWDGFAEVIDGVAGVIKGIINNVIGIVEGMANAVVAAINTMIRAINTIDFTVPDWIPGVGGNSVGFNIREVNKVSIPRLADGAVIRGGNPFMAVLGDQPHGQTNIETPLPTMVKAFKQAIAETGGAGGGEYTFVAQLDGKTIFEETVKQDQMYRKTKGRSKFAY